MRLAIALFWLAGAAFAQTGQRFEAASVRPGTGGDRPLNYTPGGVAGTVTLRRLILEAYHISLFQLSGGPGWMNTDNFAIEARAAGSTSRDDLRMMLQTLLAERFKLVVRRDKKKMPVYALTVTKGGPKLREIKPGDPVPAPEPANPPLVRVFFVESLRDFADRLNSSNGWGRPVADRTGLSGVYVLDLLAHGWEDLIRVDRGSIRIAL